MALPKEHRLTEKYDFNRVRRLGKSFSTPLFFLNIAPAKNPQYLRFGIVVSTKIDKRAVARNRVKRLLSEAIIKHLASKPSHKKQNDTLKVVTSSREYDVVIVAKPGIVGKSYEEIADCFNKILPKTPLANS
jgi:ribonuclease P protein component